MSVFPFSRPDERRAPWLWIAALALLVVVTRMLMSPAVSWATGIPEFGRRLWHWNVFRIPEEAPRRAEETSIAGPLPDERQHHIQRF